MLLYNTQLHKNFQLKSEQWLSVYVSVHVHLQNQKKKKKISVLFYMGKGSEIIKIFQVYRGITIILILR